MEQFFARSFHLKKYLKTVSFGVNSKTSKSKADESQILNEVQNLFATGQPHLIIDYSSHKPTILCSYS